MDQQSGDISALLDASELDAPSTSGEEVKSPTPSPSNNNTGDYNELAEEYVELVAKLPDRDCSYDDADYYAVQFLKAGIKISKVLRNIRNDLILLNHNQRTAEKQAYDSSEGKTHNPKKFDAQVDMGYLKESKKYEKLLNTKKYFKSLYELFTSAHQYYKNLARDK